ncbi:MAG: CRISPR-associated endonuclease Cas2 [Thiobacillus sp.]|nr:CRISPR-associated endonuclease Cas2 [Thiobacillus sp.]
MSPARDLYLIAYDIAEPRRLARVTRYMKGWKAAGQKSFCECWLTPAERRNILAGLADLIDAEKDRIHILQLDPRMQPRLFGCATRAAQPVFTIF